jgi:hypothetical protein
MLLAAHLTIRSTASDTTCLVKPRFLLHWTTAHALISGCAVICGAIVPAREDFVMSESIVSGSLASWLALSH